jgi:hypothetical protein
VEAISFGYFEPTFEPDRTIPPGNGRATFGRRRIASTAAWDAAWAAPREVARIRKLPPPTADTTPVSCSTRNSPSMTGIRQ